VGIQGSPKVRCDLLFWLDVGTASDRATRWALVTFGVCSWLHCWRRSNTLVEPTGRCSDNPMDTVLSRYKRQLIQLNMNKSGLYGLEWKTPDPYSLLNDSLITRTHCITVFPTLADVVEVETGSRSSAHWSTHVIRLIGWLSNSFIP